MGEQRAFLRSHLRQPILFHESIEKGFGNDCYRGGGLIGIEFCLYPRIVNVGHSLLLFSSLLESTIRHESSIGRDRRRRFWRIGVRPIA